MEVSMADMVWKLCDVIDVSLSEVARSIGQTQQNFNKKLKRDTLLLKELIAIADVLDIYFEQSFVLENSTEIKMGNRTDYF